MRRATAAVSVLWGAAIGLWLLSVTGRGAPASVERGAVALALLATFGVGGAWTVRAARRAGASRDPTSLLAPALFLLALAVRLVGLDHEVGELFYLDEGTYSHHAAQINRGHLLRQDFVYPHLLYYLDAFALWTAGLFREGVAGAAQAVYGLEEWQAVRRLVMRLVVALAGAATALPVFALGRRLAGPLAGAAGALLIVFSPLYNDGSHLAICDIPSAFFAALCLAATARLLEGEESRWYLLAGAAAGLAAAAKYPAGLVAVAPLAVWIQWRIRDRRFRPGLLQAGLAALGCFLAANPGLLAYPERALHGRRGVFFGAYQYGGEGWFGAVPPSAPLWYLGQLSWSFGWPVLILGLGGVVLLPAAGRRRLLWLLPFPVLYLGLISTLDVVVARNLYPALPPLAAFLGAGVVTAARRLAPGGERMRPVLATAGACAVLALPVIRTVFQDVALARPGTRVLAREWIRENVPRGATILRESYTPDLSPAEYDDERLGRSRFVAALPVEEIRRPEIDFVLLSSGAYQRFFNAQGNTGAREREMAERYRTVFEDLPLVARFPPGPARLGPELRLYRVIPDPPVYRARRSWASAELFVPDGGMRAGPAAAVEFTREGQWALAKGFLEPGSYRLEVRGRETGPGAVTVRGLASGHEERVPLEASVATLRVPARDKVFLYLARPPGSRIAELEVRRLPGGG
ncbi:MAG TPA: glycosyltransferase family 39 protein [Thermoanaerobaculia bacterium]|nr:glycosyltransferase family 39 protein [Thermoanaerobaculia bacterium]